MDRREAGPSRGPEKPGSVGDGLVGARERVTAAREVVALEVDEEECRRHHALLTRTWNRG